MMIFSSGWAGVDGLWASQVALSYPDANNVAQVKE